MSEIQAVYTSIALARHVAQMAATDAEVKAVLPARGAFLAEYPGSEFYGYGGVIDTVYFPNGNPDPTVWKKATGRRNSWNRFQTRAKGGEEMEKRLRAMSAPDRTVFSGMPEFVGAFSRPGYRLIGTVDDPKAIWLVWSRTPEEVEKSPSFDASQWERMKVSAYYIMLEEVGAE